MELRIRVGAAVDRSMSEAYRPLVKAAEQARDTITRSSRRAAQGQVRETQRGTRDEERAYAKLVRETERWRQQEVRAAEKAAQQQANAAEKAARDEVRAAEKAARDKASAQKRELAATRREARARAREELAAMRDVERELERGRRQKQREDAKAARTAERDKGNHWSKKFFDPHRNAEAAFNLGGAAARKAYGIATDIAHGAGVRTDLGSYIGGEVALEKGAVDLSNAGYMPGDAGPNGKRVDPNEIIAQMRDVGQATAFDPGQALEGLSKFVAKTGDLQSGRDVILDMARYSRASGAGLEDMVDAAGDVSNALGDIPNKGEAIKNVMRAIAAQGKEGAVEIKDLATQMAKLGAASSQFTGESTIVMAQMGALAQMTRAKGGAASATQAATAVGSFTNTFSKGARLDAFKKYGVDIRGADQKIDLKKTILGSIEAAGSAKHGGMAQFDRNMGKMFMDVSARRVTKGFETVYKDAGGGQAGLQAVEKALDDLTNATMNEKEITESFTRSMKTTEAQTQLFNNEMSKTANELKTVLTPAFQGLAPVILGVTKSAVDWFAGISGIKREREVKEQLGTEMRASNASSALFGAIGSSTIADDDIQAVETEAAQSKKALEAEIAKRQKDMSEAHWNFGTYGKLSTAPEEHVRKEAAGGDETAERYLQDKEAVARMKDTLEQMTRRQDELADRLASKTLRVVLVGDTRPPSLDLNAIGRTTPPEATPR